MKTMAIEKNTARFRYRLRALFLLFGFLAVVLASLGRELHRAKAEHQVITIVQQSGGFVQFDCSSYDLPYCKDCCADSMFRGVLRNLFGNKVFGKVKTVVCGPTTTEGTIAELRKLKFLIIVTCLDTTIDIPIINRLVSLNRVHHIKLYRCTFAQAAYPELGRLSHLQALEIVPAGMQYIDVALLDGLECLRLLAIEYATVDLNALEAFNRVSQLEYLSLKHSICLGSFDSLRGLNELSHLDLQGTSIGDEDISIFNDMKALRVLNIQNTQFSREGVAQLRAILPHCDVIESRP